MIKFANSFVSILICLCIFSSDAADVNSPIIRGELTQGSLLRGKVAANTLVKVNDTEIQVSPQGEFVFGFGRDAGLEQNLSWKSANATQWQTRVLSLSKREYKLDKIEGVAQKYVSPPTEVLTRIREDNKKIGAARATRSSHLYFNEAFILPAEGRISGVYGSQRIFNGEPKRPHYGLDIANKTGTPVVAPASGVVSLAHNDMYYSGGTLIMDHGFGVSSTFIHLSKLHVTEGQLVEQGDIIAEIGATGRVTGPHLDWRINWFKERLDPALLLEQSALPTN